MLQTVERCGNVSDEMEIAQFVGEDVREVWPIAAPYLQRALRYTQNEITLDDLYQFCLKGTMQLFIGVLNERIGVVCVTEFVQYPQRKILRIVALSGKELRKASAYLPLFYDWCMKNEASEIEAWCRPSMVRFLRQWGYEPAYTLVRLNLRRRMH